MHPCSSPCRFDTTRMPYDHSCTECVDTACPIDTCSTWEEHCNFELDTQSHCSLRPTLHVSHRTHCFERVLDAGAVTDARFGSSIDRETRIRPGAHRTSPVPGSRALECRLELALLPPLVALLFSFSAFFPLEKMWHLQVCERSTEKGTYRAWTYLVFVILCLFRVICAAPRTPSVMFATAKPLGSQLL